MVRTKYRFIVGHIYDHNYDKSNKIVQYQGLSNTIRSQLLQLFGDLGSIDITSNFFLKLECISGKTYFIIRVPRGSEALMSFCLASISSVSMRVNSICGTNRVADKVISSYRRQIDMYICIYEIKNIFLLVTNLLNLFMYIN